MKVTRTSIISRKTTSLDLDITQEQMDDYNSGTVIQKAFPGLSVDDREFIMSGITKAEWDAAFGNEQ